MPTLYYSPGACALASHIAMEEAGAPYDLKKIDLRAGEQRTPEYLAVNPKGSTPALATAEGNLSENVAILAYIARSHPGKDLAPEDPWGFAQFVSFNAYLGGSVHPALGKVLFSRPPLEGQAKTDATELALSKLDMVETHLMKEPWALGDWSLSDGYLYVFERWAFSAGLLDKARFPKLNAHLKAVQARPAVQRVLKVEGLEPL
ncbi:glutathione S-transferase N-terminal domain-containing protein [Brevundimonas sp. 2R-24]|uniref:Glutathione S-transferase N-terminal domain-containing protein n=1 Tax=Peiella sedimenti TaxID=3061083 RepID=A0ABT8SI31_9CAUL|nr:glutathione S-transferase N-terminal domain-containing protein [Caulobacteraceae bacterium XZ-24]